MQVAQPDVHQRLQLGLNVGDVLKQRQDVGHGGFQHVGDGLALEEHLQSFLVVAPPAADFAGDVHVGQKVHLDRAQAVALASLAAPALDVEAEAPGAVAALARLRQQRKQLTNRSEDAGVGGGIAAGCAADGGLINFDYLVDFIGPTDGFVRAGLVKGAVEPLRQRAIENVVHQR